MFFSADDCFVFGLVPVLVHTVTVRLVDPLYLVVARM